MCGFRGPYDCRRLVRDMQPEYLILLSPGRLILQFRLLGYGTNGLMRTRTPKSARSSGAFVRVHKPQMIIVSGKDSLDRLHMSVPPSVSPFNVRPNGIRNAFHGLALYIDASYDRYRRLPW